MELPAYIKFLQLNVKIRWDLDRKILPPVFLSSLSSDSLGF